MRKTTLPIVIILILMSALALAQDISLESPAANASSTSYEQDFIYSFEQDFDIKNCSLIVDDEVVKFRNTLLKRNNNKVSAELGSGMHEWYIQCYETDGSEMLSETRILHINIGGELKKGYEIEYYENGLRSYVIMISPEQEDVSLPAVKGGEDIQIIFNDREYYFDIIKMGSAQDTSFVEVRYRPTGKIHRMLSPESRSFDLDNDGIVELNLSLEQVERNINAYFSVYPYPESQAEEPPAEEEEETEAPVEEPEQEPEEEQKDESPVQEEEPEAQPAPEEKPGVRNWMWPIILVLIIIALVVIIVLLAGTKGKKPKSYEKPAEKNEQKPEDRPEQTPEDFEIIKSTGRGKKK